MRINGKFVAVTVVAIQSIVINCVLSQKENANRKNIFLGCTVGFIFTK